MAAPGSAAAAVVVLVLVLALALAERSSGACWRWVILRPPPPRALPAGWPATTGRTTVAAGSSASGDEQPPRSGPSPLPLSVVATRLWAHDREPAHRRHRRLARGQGGPALGLAPGRRAVPRRRRGARARAARVDRRRRRGRRPPPG